MNSIMLSESVARKLFGDVDPVNKVISMDAQWDLKVTGVYEDLPRNSEFYEASYFAPLDRYLNGWATLDAWDNYHMYIYVQLNPGYEVNEVSGLIKNSMVGHSRAESKQQVFLQPMSQWHLYSEFKNGLSTTSERLKFVWFYGIIGAFVLILACINFMNLSTARSEKRAREVGIRKSIGSLRSQLIHQFLGESFLVVLIAFFFSFLILILSLPWFNQLADKTMAISWRMPEFWLSCAIFIFITAGLAGSYPAFYLSSVNTVKALKGAVSPGRFTALPRRMLVVFQFTVSISLVIGTLIVYQQLQFVKDRPVGYERNGLIELRPKSPEYFGKYEVLRNELKKTGVVEEVAEANYSVLSTLGWNGKFYWKGKADQEGPSFNTILRYA